MAIEIQDNFKIEANKPIDTRYGPYTSILEANASIPISYRYFGLTVLINNVEYWYLNDINDTGLILKFIDFSGDILNINNDIDFLEIEVAALQSAVSFLQSNKLDVSDLIPITNQVNLLTNTKQNNITLVTTGNSGAATFNMDILNIPVYSIEGLSGVPDSRELTINGTTYNLTANRTWTIDVGVTSFNTRTGDITLTQTDVLDALGNTPIYIGSSAGGDLSGTFPLPTVVWANGYTTYDSRYVSLSGTYNNPSWLNQLEWSKITSRPTTISGYGITDPIVLTSNSYANPSWITSFAWNKLTEIPNIFLQSGNAFGATAVLGTTDTQDFSIITNNVTRLTIGSAGNVAIGASVVSTRRLQVTGSDSTSSNFALGLNNSTSNPIFSFRNDGSLRFGSTTFGPSISIVNASNVIQSTATNLQFRYNNGEVSMAAFLFDSVTSNILDINTSFVSIQPTITNTNNFIRTISLLSLVANITQFGTNIVNGLNIAPTVTGGDYIAINTASGRHIFGGAVDHALRLITGVTTLNSTDYYVQINASSNFTVTLPTITNASNTRARTLILKRIDTNSGNTVTLLPASGSTEASTIASSSTVRLYWDNTNTIWRTF